MPVLLEFIYEDDSKERVKLPVEIWQREIMVLPSQDRQAGEIS